MYFSFKKEVYLNNKDLLNSVELIDNLIEFLYQKGVDKSDINAINCIIDILIRTKSSNIQSILSDKNLSTIIPSLSTNVRNTILS